MQTYASSIKSLFFKNFFPINLIVLGLISLALLMKRHQAEFAVSILEAVLIFYATAAYLWTKNKPITIINIIRWGSFLYILLSYFYAVSYKEANLFDFLLIYKSFIYLFFLTFLTNKKFMSYNGVNKLIIVLFGIFFIKYLLAIALKIDPRPVVYMENNFELMFLYALYLIRYMVNKEKYLQLLGLVGLITILSLSRASLLMYSILVLFVIYDSFKKTRVFIIPGAILVLGGIVYLIFSQRSGSLEEVDRYKFMLVWWSNVKDWNFSQWLAGAERVSRLNDYSCGIMNYFKNLFSYSKDGTCYSVILHSFLLRVIYDHGILGLLFIIYSTCKLLIKSRVRKDVVFIFVFIVLINGLSVSSFNNLFFAISMVFLMTTNLAFPALNIRTSKVENLEHNYASDHQATLT